ncbi:hypothetical protein [Promicromonospora iranensis]|uniref:Uncharacterized protein n=1 Tax=Promicromonospora iranensis TaxID=1105144 RepID=A0ABU2CVI4_9MICO|nr:hypothetical protein [Promicromonospora iranensis]MDR7385345.1 hypothetical protein [Promicromonospora iranensis]
MLTALGVLFGALTWLDSRAANREQIELATEANERERADWQREEAQRAAESTTVAEGPVRLSAGYPFWMGPKGYAFPDALLDLGGLPWDSSAPAQEPGYRWLASGPIAWVPTSAWESDVVVEATASGTVLVQGVEVRDRTCVEPLDGTFLGMPNVGGPGEDAPPILLGVDVEAPRPVTRERDGLKELGDPWTGQLALEKGDARAVSVRFVAATKHCTFKADLVVHANGAIHRIPLPHGWGENGAPDGYTFEISGPVASYQNAYYVEAYDDTVIQTLPLDAVAGFIRSEG